MTFQNWLVSETFQDNPYKLELIWWKQTGHFQIMYRQAGPLCSVTLPYSPDGIYKNQWRIQIPLEIRLII